MSTPNAPDHRHNQNISEQHVYPVSKEAKHPKEAIVNEGKSRHVHCVRNVRLKDALLQLSGWIST